MPDKNFLKQISGTVTGGVISQMDWDLIDYSAFMLVIPDDWVGSFVDHIRGSATPSMRLDAMQRLHTVRHALQYSTSPFDQGVTFDSIHQIDPLDDAYTATIKSVVRTLCRQGELPIRCKPGPSPSRP